MTTVKHVPSEELTLEMIPDPEDAFDGAIWTFIHTFNAYGHWGGFEEAQVAMEAVQFERLIAEAEAAGEEFFRWPEPEVDLIRTNMFLDLRAFRHNGGRGGGWGGEDPTHIMLKSREGIRHLLWTLEQQALESEPPKTPEGHGTSPGA